MSSFHLLRSVSRLPVTLGRHGQLSLAKSCVSAQLCRPTSNVAGFRPLLTSTLAKNLLQRPITQSPVVGAVAVTQSRAASATGDHVRLWQVERLISVALIGLAPACIILENPVVDGLLAVLMVMHSHWGLEAVVLDYARPIVVGPIVPKIGFFVLNLLSAATLAGLLLLIYNGPGLGTTIKNLWAVGKNNETE